MGELGAQGNIADVRIIQIVEGGHTEYLLVEGADVEIVSLEGLVRQKDGRSKFPLVGSCLG